MNSIDATTAAAATTPAAAAAGATPATPASQPIAPSASHRASAHVSPASIRWIAPRECEITPSWIGGDGEFSEGVGSANTRVLKRHFTDENALYASPVEHIRTLLRAASDAGVAPNVIYAAGDDVIMELLPESWRPAKLDELRESRLLLRTLDLRRRVHDLDIGPRAATCARSVARRSVVDDVATMREACLGAGLQLPRDIDRMLTELSPLLKEASAIAHKPVLCHGDGAASNILINTADAQASPLLTGWSVAGLRDPYEEAGSIISELHPFCVVDDAQVLLRLGLDVDFLYAAQAFAVLDGIFWGLIGLWRSHINANKEIDCTKYGMWRIVKARYQLSTFPELSAWLKERA